MDYRDRYSQIAANAILNSFDEIDKAKFEALYGISPDDVVIEDIRYRGNPELWDVMANIDKGNIYRITSVADWGRDYFEFDEMTSDEVDDFFKYNEFGKWITKNVDEGVLDKIGILDYAISDADTAIGYIAWLSSYEDTDWCAVFQEHPEAVEFIDFEAFGRMCLEEDRYAIEFNGDYFYTRSYNGNIGEELEDQAIRYLERNEEER